MRRISVKVKVPVEFIEAQVRKDLKSWEKDKSPEAEDMRQGFRDKLAVLDASTFNLVTVEFGF